MNHPYEILAEYADGALPDGERAVVSAHLDGCPECRAEMALARAARQALSSLSDEPVPAGLGAAAVAAASGEAAATAATPRWYRAAGFAAAAAVVGLLAIALPRLGSGDAPPSPHLEAATQPDGAATTPGSTDLSVESRDTNFNHESIAGLVTGKLEAEDPVGALTGDAGDQAAAIECLNIALPGREGHPVRLIRARFQGVDAYIGVYEVGSGTGEPPDRRLAVAASVDGCRLLSSADYTI